MPKPKSKKKSLAHRAIESIGYSIGDVLGRGAFSTVHVGTHLGTSEMVALKFCNENSNTTDDSYREMISNEIEVMLNIGHHKNIIFLYDLLVENNESCLVIEYADRDTLKTFLTHFTRLNEHACWGFFHQLVAGVNFMHRQHIAHLDLKLENILLQTTTQGLTVKIADFGMSQHLRDCRWTAQRSGTHAFASPERFTTYTYDGKRADVWSLGIILYYLASGTPPPGASNPRNFSKDIQFPSYFSKQLKHFLMKTLEINPEERITINHMRKHLWWISAQKWICSEQCEMSCKVHEDEALFDMDNLNIGQPTLKLSSGLRESLLANKINVTSVAQTLQDSNRNYITTSFFLLWKKLLKEQFHPNAQVNEQRLSETSIEANLFTNLFVDPFSSFVSSVQRQLEDLLVMSPNHPDANKHFFSDKTPPSSPPLSSYPSLNHKTSQPSPINYRIEQSLSLDPGLLHDENVINLALRSRSQKLDLKAIRSPSI